MRLLTYPALSALLVLFAQAAHADLMLFPTRVVIEGNQRAAQVDLVNRGTKPETYRISIVNRRMTESGEIVEAKDRRPGEQLAEELIRYSPRQVTLQPGVGQTVRVLLRKPAELPDGEYRSHMQFDRLPDPEGQSSLEAPSKPGDENFTISLQTLIGANIPVIVRHGATKVSVTLTDLTIKAPAGPDKGPTLAFTMNRSGNRSAYGDLTVRFTPKSGQAVELAKVGGIAVYVPLSARKASLPLQMPAGVALAGGTVQLTYREKAEEGGKVIAEANLTLP